MDNSRMNTADMLQYCKEALAWEDFGPVDIFFFESVRKIILGQCSPFDEPENEINDLLGIERPVRDDELEPDYDKYADIYYTEDGEDELPDYSSESDDAAFGSALTGGFFSNEPEEQAETEIQEDTAEDGSSPSFTVNV